MTDQIKARFDFYVEKTGSPPRFQNVMRDFKVTEQEARLLLSEYNGKSNSTVFPPNPAEPRKERVLKISKEAFDAISDKEKEKEKVKDFHEAVVQQGGAMVALRVTSGLIALACIARGSTVIFELNSSDVWYAVLSAIIFQGGSAVLPILGMVYFTISNKKLWFNSVIGILFMLGGLGSMSYEVYASVANFHQLNVKQEISIKASATIIQDAKLQAIQDKIDSQKKALAQTEAQLALRQKEYGEIGDSGTPESLAKASAKVGANKSQAERESAILQSYLKEKTDRLDILENKSDTSSSAISLVSGDRETKNGFEFWIILVPSIFMVLFTPVFSSVTLFGINIPKEESNGK